MSRRSDVDRTAPDVVPVATTPFGKTISIAKCKGRLFEITVSGGGTKPPELSGKFTSWREAQFAVNGYDGTRNTEEATK